MRTAYEAGKATAEYSYDDIIYGDMAPSWIFENQDANEFFEAGRNGYEMPEHVTGWRYGPVPESGRSNNYRDGRLERGVSVMQLEGAAKVKTLAELHSLSSRKKVRVAGYLNPNDVGGDGEPLLLCAEEIG